MQSLYAALLLMLNCSFRNLKRHIILDARVWLIYRKVGYYHFQNGTKPRVSNFKHGADGLGNQNFPPPSGKPIEQSAADFLTHQASLFPGKITVVALGPLTNIAMAIQSDPNFVKNVGQIILLGGGFLVNKDINPAAEANISGDRDAADIVFACGANVMAIGINITRQLILSDADRDRLEASNGVLCQYLCKLLECYFSYHHEAYNIRGIYLHDPTTLLAAVDPSLMTFAEGVVRLQADGISRVLTLSESNEWSGKPSVKVAVTVDAPAVVELVMNRIIKS